MLNLNSKIKKSVVSVMLILFIFTSIFSVPIQTKAVWWATFPQQAVQIAQFAAKTLWEQRNRIYDALLRAVAERILERLTTSIVNWINTGFEGNPSFITDPGKFIRDTADIVVGDLLKGSALEFLCDPFKLQVKLALGLQYRSFKENISCSFSSVMGNVNDAMNKFTNGDFINGGGWDSWLQITTNPQNNAMGAMLIAQLEMDERIKKDLDIKDKELSWGSGFMSYYKCTNLATKEVTYGSNKNSASGEYGPYLYDCEVTTPGTALANTTNWANTSVIRKVELANSADRILGAIVTLAVKKLQEGLSSQKTGNSNRTARENDLQRLESQYNTQLAQVDSTYRTNINNNQHLNGEQKSLYNGVLQREVDSSKNYGDGSGSSGSGSGSGSSGGSYNSNGSVNFNQSFASKMEALGAIDNQISIENQYISAQNNLFRLLSATQNAASSSNCEAPIKDLIVKQITGEYTGDKSLQWNKRDITLASSTANTALITLNSTRTSIEATNDSNTISNLTQSLDSLNRHSATDVISAAQGGALYEQTRLWIASQIDEYSPICTISKSGLSEWGIQ